MSKEKLRNCILILIISTISFIYYDSFILLILIIGKSYLDELLSTKDFDYSKYFHLEAIIELTLKHSCNEKSTSLIICLFRIILIYYIGCIS